MLQFHERRGRIIEGARPGGTGKHLLQITGDATAPDFRPLPHLQQTLPEWKVLHGGMAKLLSVPLNAVGICALLPYRVTGATARPAAATAQAGRWSGPWRCRRTVASPGGMSCTLN